MTAAARLRCLFNLHQLGLHPHPPLSACLLRGLCNSAPSSPAPKPSINPENKALLQNLSLLGVDVKMVRQRLPGILCRTTTNEHAVAQFLSRKGANPSVIASIISRYPRAITRSVEHLEQRWEIWREIVTMDSHIVTILSRSPESFFRSSDNENLIKNIQFFTSLGMNAKFLNRLLSTAPRTFSNSHDLNKQMVEFLMDLCSELEGDNPKEFAKAVISRNLFILIKSTKRVKNNIDLLRSSLELSNSELLTFLPGSGSLMLDISNEWMKKNLQSHQKKMASLGCCVADIKKYFLKHPFALSISPQTLNAKLDCLLEAGVTVQQILDKPKVLDYSIETIAGRLAELKQVEYNIKKNGIGILDSGRKRFEAKMAKLRTLPSS